MKNLPINCDVYFLSDSDDAVHIGTVVDTNAPQKGYVYVRNNGCVIKIEREKVFTNKRKFMEHLFENQKFIY